MLLYLDVVYQPYLKILKVHVCIYSPAKLPQCSLVSMNLVTTYFQFTHSHSFIQRRLFLARGLLSFADSETFATC